MRQFHIAFVDGVPRERRFIHDEMKTEQIALTLAIARERSVSKAARVLFISQPTASNMLRALEEELGYPLFTRGKSGMLPTEEGAEFLEHARAIERSMQSISHIRKHVRRIDFKVLSYRADFSELAFERLCEKEHKGTVLCVLMLSGQAFSQSQS